MSLYLIIFVFLLLGTLYEYIKGETPRYLFAVTFLGLTVMLVLRFGQGTDYISYCSIYTTMPLTIAEMKTYLFADIEMGWRFVCAGFKLLGFSFRGFIAFIGIAEMLLLWKFLKRYCKYKFLALFMGYHTLYLTYCFSALRQGIVVVVFLGLLLQWLIEGKYIRYLIVAVLCAAIHNVGVVLILPLIVCALRLSFSKMVCTVAVGFCAGILLAIFNVGIVLKDVLGIVYFGDTSISVVALAERVLSYIFVTYTAYLCLEGKEPDDHNTYFVLFKIYSMGMFLYAVLMWSPLVSSRTIYIFKVIEIALISCGIAKCKKARCLVFIYCILISSVLYFKNINSYITEGEYRDASIISYPYVSVLQPREILEHRGNVGQFIRWLEVDVEPWEITKYEQEYLEAHPQ